MKKNNERNNWKALLKDKDRKWWRKKIKRNFSVEELFFFFVLRITTTNAKQKLVFSSNFYQKIFRKCIIVHTNQFIFQHYLIYISFDRSCTIYFDRFNADLLFSTSTTFVNYDGMQFSFFLFFSLFSFNLNGMAKIQKRNIIIKEKSIFTLYFLFFACHQIFAKKKWDKLWKVLFFFNLL